jgi:hypothetical protein
MATCFLLGDVSTKDVSPERTDRFKSLIAVMLKLGFKVTALTSKICNPENASNIGTQTSIYDGWQVEFIDKAQPILDKGVKGDIIVATEAWHSLCFKGMLELYNGRREDVPVIEVWIDYSNPFAHWKSFFCESARHLADITSEMDPDYCNVSAPYVDIRCTYADMYSEPFHVTDQNCSDYLWIMGRGIPVVGLEDGSLIETVKNGVNGYTYLRSDEFEQAKSKAIRISSYKLCDYIKKEYSLEKAASGLKPLVEAALSGKALNNKE